jgi:hypothetical protein
MEGQRVKIGRAFCAGLAIGGAVVAFSVKWPAVCRVDGVLFWTAAAAIGGMAAAGGSVYAARVALRIAQDQMGYQRAKGVARAANIAVLVRGEIAGALASVKLVDTVLSNISDKMLAKDLYRLAGMLPVSNMDMATRYAVELDELENGHLVAKAVHHVSQLAEVVETFRNAGEADSFVDADGLRDGMLKILAKNADETRDALFAALAVLPGA